MKTACIIQGDIRNGFELVLKEMQKHFNVVVVSTWEDEVKNVTDDDVVTVFNQKPKVAGYSHRNYQRYSISRGLEKAKELGCEYVMKWRTDMLPTKLDVNQLIKWANYNVPNGVSSRIVTCAFRNLTVYEDWFSSMPDLFAFGHIDMMEMLWGDDGFDYTKMMNPPQQMLIDEGEEWAKIGDVSGYWCAESELYAIFKDRLQKKLGIKLSHENIARNHMRLFDHNSLGIVWFGEDGNFRPIFQAWQHPWWSESAWMGEKQIKYVTTGYRLNDFKSYFKSKFGLFVRYIEMQKQKKYLKEYLNV